MKKIRLFAILVIVLVVILAFFFREKPLAEDTALLDPNYSFTDPVQITTAPGKNQSPSILLGINGNFYLAWSSDRGGNYSIWMKESVDGITWSEPWQITNTSENDLYPVLIQGKDGIFHLIWQRNDLNASNRFNIWYAYSLDGKIWQYMHQVTKSDTDDQTPSITLDDNNRITLAWSSNRSGNADIYISSLAPTGWQDPLQITFDSQADTYPFIFKRQGSEYGILWNRQEDGTPNTFTLFAISSDGNSWSTPTQLFRNESFSISHSAIFPCGYGYCGVLSSNSHDPAGDIYFANLSNPNNTHRATALLNQSDNYPKITPTNQVDTWLLVWVVGDDESDIFARFIQLKD